MWARHLCGLLLILAVVLAPARLAAADDDDGPTIKERKKAKQLIDGAVKAKDKGDKLLAKGKDEQARKAWREAALAYIEAYSIIEHPFLLFKLSEIYRVRGEKLWALAGFYTYLTKDPEGPGAERARTAVAELEKELAAERKAKETGEGDAELDPTAVFDPLPPLKQPDKPKPKPRPVAVKKPLERAPVDDGGGGRSDDGPGHPGRNLRWSGYASAGLGVVLLAVGIGYGIEASAASSDLSSKEGGWNLADRRRIEAGEKAEKNQIIYTLLGVAAVGAGGALWWLGDRAERRAIADERARAALIPTPGGALLAVGGRF